MNNQALRFIDTSYMAPELIRHLSVCRNLNRQLWQEDNNSVSVQSDGSISSGFYSGDDEMETSPTKVKPEIPMETSPIKVKPEIPKITFEIERPECTSNNGVCRECELSRKIEAAYQSEKSKCTQQ
jgi:hypothetical protein